MASTTLLALTLPVSGSFFLESSNLVSIINELMDPDFFWPWLYPVDLKNKFAHAVALLFRQTYLKSWTTFFSEMLALIAPLPQSSGKSNMKMVDLFLRILMSIDEEVVNTLTSRTSSKEENTLNINIVGQY